MAVPKYVSFLCTTPRPAVNEGMLAALGEIAEFNKGRPFIKGSDTQRLLREARNWYNNFQE